MKKARLDQVLVDRSFYPSREQARRAVMAGEVRIGDRRAEKPSLLIDPEEKIATEEPPKFVGRGGLKLEGALDHFQIQVNNLSAIDLGASTGGFTDCLLQRGAREVWAIDVGHGQLAWKIRNDSRVTVREKLNARLLRPEMLEHAPFDLCVIDVSFISLTLILPNAFDLLTPDGMLLALIKPQFELERHDVGRGGIVRDSALHEKVEEKISGFIAGSGNKVIGRVPSVIAGTDGNQEFFVCAQKRSA